MLSILIVSWNERKLLERCLTAVRRSVDGFESETIVVDNGSTDGSTDLVRRRFPEARLLTNDRNWGYAHANNQAFDASSGEYVLLLNDDAVITLEALRALLETLRRQPTRGGATPRYRNADGSTQYGYHRRRASALRLIGAFLHNGGICKRNRWARQYFRLDDDFRHSEIIEQPAGTCWLLRRQAIVEAGGLFNARCYPIHFNDVDLAERLTRRGWQTALVPEAEVLHDGGQAVERLNPYVLKELYLVSQVLFFRRWRPFPEYLLLKSFFILLTAGYLVLTRVGLLHRYFRTSIVDRQASADAQSRILQALFSERLPAGWVPSDAKGVGSW